MRRFFTEPDNIDLDNGTLTIIDDAVHISKVLRMECGDKIIVFDGTGYEYEAMLIKIEKEKSIANILGRSLLELEPETKVTLFQGIPKSDKLEIIVQKAVELGVHDIVPVKTSRSVAKIADDKKGRQKIERLNKISKEAAKQCGRGLVPKVSMPVVFSAMADILKNYDLSIMFYEELGHDGKKNLKEILRTNPEAESIAVLIGPEGGFSPSEAETIQDMNENTFCAGLGKRILRTETAGSTALSVIMYVKDEI